MGAQAGGRGAQQPENVLAGVIDLHHHQEPDERERNMDIIDASLYARLRGMRGAVFKSHGQQTATTTWLAAKMVPNFLAIPVIDLNLVHGGLNTYAVDNFATIVKKPQNPAADIGLVMMPSETSCYQRQVEKSNEACVAISTGEAWPLPRTGSPAYAGGRQGGRLPRVREPVAAGRATPRWSRETPGRRT